MIRLNVELSPLGDSHAIEVLKWRNQDDVRQGLRTPHMISKEEQHVWFDSLQARHHRDRYWAVNTSVLYPQPRRFVAQVGLVGIEWENGLAEISLITEPSNQRQGFGKAALFLALREAFSRMRLRTVWGECYYNNPALGFWEKLAKQYSWTTTTLPQRKFWGRRLWDSLYFSIDSTAYELMRSDTEGTFNVAPRVPGHNPVA